MMKKAIITVPIITPGPASSRHCPMHRLSMCQSSAIASPKTSGGMKTKTSRWPSKRSQRRIDS